FIRQVVNQAICTPHSYATREVCWEALLWQCRATWRRTSRQIRHAIHGHVRYKTAFKRTGSMKESVRKRSTPCTSVATPSIRRTETMQAQ
ncbi:hypothetical protein JI435_084910, partial [Parastagonospora nodorum SN15]